MKAVYHKTPLKAFNNPNLIQVQCNILDITCLENIMQGVKEIYHCAGLVSYVAKDAENLYKVNVEGTANIVNAALNEGIRKMVHVSSVAALDRIKGQKINEVFQWGQVASNKYGKSKYLGELEVWRGIAEGLNAVIINPSLILGPGNWDNSSTAIFKSAYNEFSWFAEGTTGFVDVKDVVKAMIMLMESNITAERFIISAQNESFHTIFNMIAAAFNKKKPSKKVTPFLARLVWRFEAIKSLLTKSSPLITKETATTALSKTAFDNSKLLKYFPAFEYNPLEETVAVVCKSLQQKLNNQ